MWIEEGGLMVCVPETGRGPGRLLVNVTGDEYENLF
jgi:hypothetical protein